MGNGYTGQVLRVDLTERSTRLEPLNLEWASKYVGGQGLGARYLLEELPKGVDPLGEANKIIFITGPLTGTSASGGGRYALVTKSPATGLFLDSYAGGQFGPELKYAGYDAMIIEGRSVTPTYLLLREDGVEFRNASHLWGKDCHEAEDGIKKEVGEDAKVLVIGPAGENLVRFACVTTEYYRHHGRGGSGAVFGSKNLKGIAVRGTRGVQVAYPAQFMDLNKKYTEQVVSSEEGGFAVSWRGGRGTAEIVDLANEFGALSTRNFRRGTFENASQINAAAAEQVTLAVQACAQCPCACGHFRVAKSQQGRDAVEGPEYETLAMLGSNCCVGNLGSVIGANLACDRLGLDTISAGNVVAWAMDCYEHGLISKKDTDGLELTFGNTSAVVELLRKIAYREGIGDVLANGVSGGSMRLGGESHKLGLQIKGLEFPGYEPRAASSMALAYATANRGACHLRAWPIGAELWGGPWMGAEPVKLYPDKPDGKAKVVVAQQHFQAYRFSTVVCDFMGAEIEVLAQLVGAATGIKDMEDWRTVGERAVNACRVFNCREGMTRQHEYLPERLHNEAVATQERAAQPIKREDFEYMLAEYYSLRGYDKNGRPTRDKLDSLDKDLRAYLEV
jgi:aldehyde:ferredoxin oxidoreductase